MWVIWRYDGGRAAAARRLTRISYAADVGKGFARGIDGGHATDWRILISRGFSI